METNRLTPRGRVALRRIPAAPARPLVRTAEEALAQASPARRWFQSTVDRWRAQNVADHFDRSLADMDAFAQGRLPFLGQLWLRKVSLSGVADLGLVSCRVVTNAGAQYIVDAFQNLTELENLKYHGVGTGTAAEAATNTALGTELTTQYSPANTRPTGTVGEQSGQTNVFETTATITVSAAAALTEHGIFSQAAVGGGTLLDRSVFAAVNLGATESLQATYRLTVPAGG